MKVPKPANLIAREITDYHYESRILFSHSKNAMRTIKNISENIALVKK